MKVELIPVIEIAVLEEDTNYLQPSEKPYWLDTEKWEDYFKKQLEINGYQDYQRIKEGYPFYSINQFSDDDLVRLIKIHLGLGSNDGEQIDISESCPFFGGYVLKVDDAIIFTPQCCGSLDDIESWRKLINTDLKEQYIAVEGHPCPKVIKSGDTYEFIFEDDWEDFIPPAIRCKIKTEDMAEALKKCSDDLVKFAQQLNDLSSLFNAEEIARYLIYGQD